jgi:signal peptidase I
LLGSAVLGVAVILVAAYARRYQSYVVPLRSMEPTIPKDSRITVERIEEFSAGRARYGDIVVFRSPRTPQEIYVQRLMGLPGDRIEVRSRQLFRNGELVSEPYVQHDRKSAIPLGNELYRLNDLPTVEVPPRRAFLMGDNRDSVVDSRYWGAIPFEDITGIVVAVVEPD